MPKLAPARNPKYRKHKATGQAVVTLNGEDHYLGRFKSAASVAAYDRLIQQWIANGRQPLRVHEGNTVTVLIAAFWKHAKNHYRHPDGRQTSELGCQATALTQLRKLYGDMQADAFGPSELRIVRDSMIQKGWARKAINIHLSRLKHLFRWGGEYGLVAPEVYHRLLCIRGLQAGRSEAKETEPIKPAPEEFVHAVYPHVSRQVRAMIELQLLTGMRSGEVTIMRACDIDMTGTVWVYRPVFHKTLWHGHQREIWLGPKAQDIIKPFLKLNTQAYLFSPSEAEAERMQKLRQDRKSNVQPSQMSRKKRKPKRKPGEHYSSGSYAKAIRRGCELATVPSWHPHQLRHNAATALRKQYGIELARIILGHKSLTRATPATLEE